MKLAVHIIATGLAMACISPALADGIQPGLWKITTTVVSNGMKSPPQTNARCLTAEQANDLAGTFSPRFGGVNTQCERTRYEKSEGSLKWRLQCHGQVEMDSAGEFTFHSPLRYTASIATKGFMGNDKIADIQMALEGTFVGACR
jgi:hypothetical protein